MTAILTAIAAAVMQPAPAQPATAAERQVEQAQQALGRGDYLEAVDGLRAAAFTPEGTPNPAGFGTWLYVHPYVGGVLDPAALAREPAGPLVEAVAERFRRAEVRDALREISARAAQTRIVILNEAHESPRDRAFALEVARALRPLGYSVLAAETFSNRPGQGGDADAMERLRRDGYPRRDTGTYTMDPVFADFVRQSLVLGYRPVAYESTTHRPELGEIEQIALREQEQAETLVARIFSNDPNARVLIYVGLMHAAEVPMPMAGGVSIEWMAARLKRMTGIDPLTIDQTLLDETVPRHHGYRALIAGRLDERPVSLFLGGRPLIEARPPGTTDLQVVHPPLRLLRGRPAWLWRIGRRPVSIPRRLLPRSGRRLIQAFVAGEAADAVPLDQIVVEAGRRAPPLLVPPGTRIRWAHQDPAPLD
jgi:hypothetical protein